ncbi:hypothetical protein AT864_02049 [Anoxybacillus sp. P3H1B]|jgi:hypothetical protein|uniref:Uncharacterized protein n=1 Tax=Anoxybacteroides rupiense TaxID=311460 RepID=A0ABD5IXI2_9BACL|nr:MULTISPECIES: hypothetical protein [Anoxybacillus]KXG09579.1 hypothetical protein AT864_02049 [Anoxybacillus sp. P3H1B]MBB3908964.1 hypothetical protein [Anoxybacillus rupiensis]MED5052450.1 hypothetical protein [Anoxybacillus rupiensis]QHC05274.1 hypothetical protein GRQ40_15940 [Anoxybacillus sp. PDR2]
MKSQAFRLVCCLEEELERPDQSIDRSGNRTIHQLAKYERFSGGSNKRHMQTATVA